MKVKEAKFVGSFPDFRKAPKLEIPEIAFGGRSNVGKSSVINTLLRRKNLAQISKTPGKTQLLNYYVLINEAGKEALYFVDLPGFGYARVPAEIRRSWKKLTEEYIEKSSRLKGFALLIDSRRGLQDEEIQLIEYLLLQKRKICPILTKIDKLSRQELSEVVKATSGLLYPMGTEIAPPIIHSSLKKTGNEEIWRWIHERINNADK
jgi:GTP-binding protein